MKIEIERKFLLASESWRAEVQRCVTIRDGLISSHDELKVRVRIIGDHATLTVKTRRIHGEREEYEFDIPVPDAEKLIGLCRGDVIEKIRHYVEHASMIWEIDEYAGLLEGVVLAEVELESRDHHLDLPGWIGREVTEDTSFRKVNLLRSRQQRQAE